MKRKQKSAFTIIEVMISITVFSVLTVSLLTLYQMSDNTLKYGINNTKTENKLSKVSRHFYTKLASSSQNQVEIQGTNDILVYKVQSDSNNGAFLKDGTFEDDFFYKVSLDNDGKLVEEVFNTNAQAVAGEKKVIVTNIDNVLFSLVSGGKSLQITIGVLFVNKGSGKVNQGGDQVWERTVSTRVTFRNF